MLRLDVEAGPAHRARVADGMVPDGVDSTFSAGGVGVGAWAGCGGGLGAGRPGGVGLWVCCCGRCLGGYRG